MSAFELRTLTFGLKIELESFFIFRSILTPGFKISKLISVKREDLTCYEPTSSSRLAIDLSFLTSIVCLPLCEYGSASESSSRWDVQLNLARFDCVSRDTFDF